MTKTKMRWTAPTARSRRFLFGYAFTPENDWMAEVKPGDVERLLAYPGEEFVVLEEELPFADESIDMGVPVSAVKALVESLEDVDLLRRMGHTEQMGRGRVSVLRAIDKRLEELNAGPAL